MCITQKYANSVIYHPTQKQPKVAMTENDNSVYFVVDSDASVNIIDEASFSQLQPKPSAEKRLVTYGAESALSLKGTFYATVESEDKITCALMFGTWKPRKSFEL